MMCSFQTKTALAFVLLAAACSVIRCELPPSVYEEWKEDADEYVSLKVVDVEGINVNKLPCKRVDYQVRARIQKVIRDPSESVLEVGEVVTLKTWYRKPGGIPGSNCPLWVGPSSPPLLADGWCGKAYMNDTSGLRGTRTYKIAAEGKSFKKGSCSGVKRPKNLAGCLKIVKKQCSCITGLKTKKKRAAAARRCARTKAGNLCNLKTRASKLVQSRFANFCG